MYSFYSIDFLQRCVDKFHLIGYNFTGKVSIEILKGFFIFTSVVSKQKFR